MNIKLLRQIKKQILAEPLQFYMQCWLSNVRHDQQKIPNCGTTACIAGWAICIVRKQNPEAARQDYLSGQFYCSSIAREFLELDVTQSDLLFLESKWPIKFQRTEKETPLQTAKRAAKRIEHFIKTKGEE